MSNKAASEFFCSSAGAWWCFLLVASSSMVSAYPVRGRQDTVALMDTVQKDVCNARDLWNLYQSFHKDYVSASKNGAPTAGQFPCEAGNTRRSLAPALLTQPPALVQLLLGYSCSDCLRLAPPPVPRWYRAYPSPLFSPPLSSPPLLSLPLPSPLPSPPPYSSCSLHPTYSKSFAWCKTGDFKLPFGVSLWRWQCGGVVRADSQLSTQCNHLPVS